MDSLLHPNGAPFEPSPFAAPPADEPDSWRYGILIPTHRKKNPHVGFFIEHEAIARLTATLRLACPGMPLDESFAAIAVGSPIRSLAANWREDWSERDRGWPWRGNDDLDMRPHPHGLGNPRSAPSDPRERFAWIQLRVNARGLDDDDYHGACERFRAIFRQDLHARGITTAEWTGRSLLMGNGFQSEELMAQAREEAESAFLSHQLRIGLAQGPSRRPKPL